LELAADAKSLKRALKFKDFYRTMSFVNALAHIANTEDHHPDLEVGYNYCRVTSRRIPSAACRRTISFARPSSIGFEKLPASVAAQSLKAPAQPPKSQARAFA
jgi:hypothetical protein